MKLIASLNAVIVAMLIGVYLVKGNAAAASLALNALIAWALVFYKA